MNKEQRSIMVHYSTLEKFRKAKVAYQAEIEKDLPYFQVSDNGFIIELLDLIKEFQKLEVRK
jgi:hypothetical protein